MKRKIIYPLLGFLFLGTQKLHSQMQIDSKKTDTLVAVNKNYKASGFKRAFWGDHYRKEWAAPVNISILDMDTYAGGLTPVKLGGGLQTASLRLKGANGKDYVLRSVNKDVSKAIVEELRQTYAQDMVQDQISSANPYAPMVVAALAQAAGIYHSTPQIFYVEKSVRLGEYNEKFSGTVCLLEERPSGNEEDNPAYGNAKNIVNTQKLLEKVFANADHQVDEKAFLKARLFDMWIGDWDRHEEQWLWASFKEDGKTFYKPIPRDRDQAFSKMDGLIPSLATKKFAVRKVQGFDYTIKDVNGMNMNGGHLDRNFTTRLSLKEWLGIAEELQDALSDNAIAKAFLEMPDTIYNISGKEMIAKLKRRRDDLQKYAKTYYMFLSQQVNITGTKDKEFFEVIRRNNDSTEVVVYKSAEENPKKTEIYRRIFVRSETKEIRLFGLDGNDTYNIKGNTKKGILIGVVGGGGKDSVIDQSFVKGGTHQTKVYDNKDNSFTTSKETKLHISNDTLKNNYDRKSFVYNWAAPLVIPAYNVDDGFIIGAGVIIKKQQYGKAPYGSRQIITGNYGTSTSSFSFHYNGEFREFLGKADLHIDAKYKSPRYSRNFYGMGNETEYNGDLDQDFYRVRMSQVSFFPSLHRTFRKYHTVSVGAGFETVRLDESENANRFITTEKANLDSTIFDRKKYADLELSYQFNSVDDVLYPRKGLKWNTGGRFIQNLDNSETNFIQLFSEASVYASFGSFTVANRAGVITNTNDDYEFFQANTIGGLTNVRGYRRERYSGKTSAYLNTELRFSISSINAYLVKGTWGLLAFADHGRVWMPNEESNTWHHGYGGGFWFLPFNKMALTATYGTSKEDNLITVKAGFLF
jgi:hypothetical protein